MTDKIRLCLEKIQFPHLPGRPDENLITLGLDSLMFVLLVVELERCFQVKFTDDQLNEKNFESLNTIKNLLSEMKK